MLVLYPNERILLQRDASITIKHKYVKAKENGKGTFYASITIKHKYVKAKENGKGTFYVTNIRIVFEDHKKGIILQVYPFQNELQAYRVNKSLLGGEKLLLDVQRQIEGKILNVLAEITIKNANEAVKAIEAMRNSINTLNYASFTTSASAMNTAPTNKEEEEPYDAFMESKTKYDTVEVPLYEGEELKGFWHDVDVYSVSYDHKGNIDYVRTPEEKGRGSKVVVTTRHAYYVTPYGWQTISGLKEEGLSYAEHKGNIAYVHNHVSARSKDRMTASLTFKTEEEAKEFVKLWWEQKRARQKYTKYDKYGNEKLVNFISINMKEKEDPKIIPKEEVITKKE